MKLAFLFISLSLFASPAFAQAWSPAALDQLVAAAQEAPAEGLPLEQARLARLSELRSLVQQRPGDGAASAELDAEASSLFARLAAEFSAGCVDPRAVDPSWHILPQTADSKTLEAQALASGNVAATLLALLPHNAEYEALRGELAKVQAQGVDESFEGFDRAARLGKLRAALERWRWLPREMPSPRLEVHVPEFHLVVMQGDTVLSTRRVIVGKTTTRTPTFTTAIDAVILNPYWTPPQSILSHEIVPKLKRDPGYGAREGFEVLDKDGHSVNAGAIDWASDAKQYHVRQKPGAKNALGRVKFDMPNPYGIYLHDTPELSLFDRLRRTFSHGCIRVQDARGLAASLLAASNYDQGVMDLALSTVTETRLPLAQNLPIFVLYLTAGRGEDGNITYVEDVYGRDKALIAALDAAALAANAPLQF